MISKRSIWVQLNPLNYKVLIILLCAPCKIIWSFWGIPGKQRGSLQCHVVKTVIKIKSKKKNNKTGAEQTRISEKMTGRIWRKAQNIKSTQLLPSQIFPIENTGLLNIGSNDKVHLSHNIYGLFCTLLSHILDIWRVIVRCGVIYAGHACSLSAAYQ